jgi:hypothetical protein
MVNFAVARVGSNQSNFFHTESGRDDNDICFIVTIVTKRVSNVAKA